MEIKGYLGVLVAVGALLIVAYNLPYNFNAGPCPGPDMTFNKLVHQTQEGRRPLKAMASGNSLSSNYQVLLAGNQVQFNNSWIRGQAQAIPPTASEKESFERRRFTAYGTAAHLFVQFGAYRGGNTSFAVVGLASKALHKYAKPGFECEWIPSAASSNAVTIKGTAMKLMPDRWGFDRIYSVVVVNCTFDEPVGTDAKGGQLILHASHGDGFGKTARIVALEEKEGSYNASLFEPTYQYEFMYCGSPLYGDLSPQRIREWMAYHAKIFGPRSHFMMHDAGGVHAGVRKVLEPWIEAGLVTVQDIRQQERFDGYYYNQFLVVNDCLHRTRSLAKWTFFFDVDEYLYVPPQDNLQYIMDGFSGYTQIIYDQSPMSNKLCLFDDPNANYSSAWGFEKLVFRNANIVGKRRDRKYAVQARNVLAAGIHFSENLVGKTLHAKGPKIKYYHYHNVIANRTEPCQEFVRSRRNEVAYYNNEPYKVDTGLQYYAPSIKKFELEKIGPQPTIL